MNFTKITIFFLLIISIFCIPVNAQPSNYSNYSHYTWIQYDSSSILDHYKQDATPYLFNINFSIYDGGITTYNALSRGTLSGSADFITGFNLTYSGGSIIVGNGSIYVNKTTANHISMNYTFYYWNETFMSEHQEMTILAIDFDNPSLFSTISDTWIVQTYRYRRMLTHSINTNIYFGSRTYDYTYVPGSKPVNNQKMIYDAIIDTTPLVEPTPDSFIQFENIPYNEYDDAIVNFSVEKIMTNYPDKRIYLEIGTPKITDPYYNYVAYELSDYTGYRGLAIEGKHPTYNAFHNCSAYIRAYDQDMGDYETLLEIEQSVLWDNHTLINYTGYDYPTNKSYITGQYIYLHIDIMDYIETDFLYWPDEHFLLHIDAFSNSNQGDRQHEYHIDPKYWNADRYHIMCYSYAPYSIIDSDFNATIESYITVYRNGNTTRLTPTIYTNMYTEGYIPEDEEGYEPPDIPEEPEDPDTGENETLPENPDIPDIPIVTNQSINTSWVYYYYEGVNNSFDTLLNPVYNFTEYTLAPVYLLNNSISDYNYIMNESFIETTQKINILSGSFNIIYSSFHPKIVGVITYYLIWLVLLIILKKR